MNLPEFKAWFEGFTEDMDKAPSAKQWGRIKEKIGLIQDAPPVTQHIFHDHYYRPWRRYYDTGPVWLSAIAHNGGAVGQMQGASSMLSVTNGRNDSQAAVAYQQAAAEAPFDSGAAFRELGRAEMRSMAKVS